MTKKTVKATRGRKPLYGGEPMEQIPVGLDAIRRAKLDAIRQHEFNRKKINVSVAEVIRAAIDWYVEWYQSENGIRLIRTGGDGKPGGE